MTAALCAECGKPSYCKGLCTLHYQRQRKHGSPLVFMKHKSPNGAPLKWLLDHSQHDGNECLIWPFGRQTDGRGQLVFGKNNRSAHRVMCEISHGQPPKKKDEASHTCNNGHAGCVNPRHLMWETRKENELRKVLAGRSTRGERQNHAKLTESDVRQIRKMHESGNYFQYEIANLFGVNRVTIQNILAGKTWGWLT